MALYLLALSPGLQPGDSPDLVKAAATFHEMHPPGYPLYAPLGKPAWPTPCCAGPPEDGCPARPAGPRLGG